MGGKSGGGTNTTVTQSDPPEYVAQAYKDLYARASDVSNTPYTAYSGDLVADLNTTQLGAFQNIQNAQNVADPYYSQASSALSSSTTPIWDNITKYSSDAVSQYYNPYLEDVINSTMANINESNAEQQTQLQGNAVSAGAWGGDRAGVAAAELARQQDLASNQTIAGLRSSGYESALSAFQQQQSQELSAKTAEQQNLASAANTYANLGTSAQQSALQGASAQLQAGALEQQQEQNKLTSDYQQWAAQQEYPFLTTEFLANNVFGLSSGSGGTSTSTGTSPTSSALSGLTGLGLTGLSLYGAISGKNAGGRIGYNRGGLVGSGGRIPYKCGGSVRRPGYIYGGLVPTTNGKIASVTGNVPVGKSFAGTGGFSPMKPSGSVSKTEAPDKTLEQQVGDAANTGLLAKKAYKGATALSDTINGWMLPETGTTFSGAEAASNAMNTSNFLNANAAAPAAESFTGALQAGNQAAQSAALLGDTATSSAIIAPELGSTFLADTAAETAATAAADTAATTAATTAAETGLLGEASSLAAMAGPLGIAAMVALPFLFNKSGGRIPYKRGGLVPARRMADGGFISEGEDENGNPDGSLFAESQNNGDKEVVAGFISPQQTSTGEEVNPWIPLLATGLSMMAGRSPNALENIGNAGMVGLQTYEQEKTGISKREAGKAKAQQEAAKLMELAEWHKKQGDIQSERTDISRQKNEIESARNKDLSAYQNRLASTGEKNVALRGQELSMGDYAPYEWTGKDEQGQDTSGMGYFNKKSGEWKGDAPPKGAALKQKSQASAPQSVFETKYNAWIQAHPEDANGALEYAGGRKTISDTELRKMSANLAQNDAKGAVNKSPDYLNSRMQFWFEKLKGEGATQQQPQKQAATAQTKAGTKENPLVPKTQEDINNAPAGTVFNINGKLMVK